MGVKEGDGNRTAYLAGAMAMVIRAGIELILALRRQLRTRLIRDVFVD